MGKMFEFVCLSACLFISLEHNSKTKDPKVSKLGIGIPWDTPDMVWFWVERLKVMAIGSLSAFITLISGA